MQSFPNYEPVQLFIAGKWRNGSDGLPVLNPATEIQIGEVARAALEDLSDAVVAAEQGFKIWSRTPAFDRAQIMIKAAALLRERANEVGPLLTMEQGKPLAQGVFEVNRAAGELEWAAGEAMRAYGKVIPARNSSAQQATVRQPVGPVALFTPWNFPINQLTRKVAPALAAGCSIVAKPPEETPAAPAALAQALQDAGLPDGVLNLVFGTPSDISEFLIAHPSIRKVSFTGSVAVGKHLARMAGQHMKRVTMELGGHAPVLIFDDADLEFAVKRFSLIKIFNGGQTCGTPNRFVIDARLHDEFAEALSRELAGVNVGNGLEDGVQMGALANDRRLAAMEHFVTDAKAKGGQVLTGGERIGSRGYFFAPTVIVDAAENSDVRNMEAFGPIAVISKFSSYEEAVHEANRLPYGLAAYALTDSSRTINRLINDVECGSIVFNDTTIGLPEMPFGGVKDSGYGAEGGSEGIDAYLNTKLVHIA